MDQGKLMTENFAEVASETICNILCNSGSKNIRKWALKFLQRAARGFGDKEHEPWIGALNTLQCSQTILSNYKPHIRKPDLNAEAFSSTLPFLLRSPLHMDLFISELVVFILNKNEAPCEQKQILDTLMSSGIKGQDNNCDDPKYFAGMSILKNAGKIHPQVSRDTHEINGAYSENSSIKRRKLFHNPMLIEDNGVKDLLHNVWIWTKSGKIKLTSEILGDLLSLLPECVEETMIDIALKITKTRTFSNADIGANFLCSSELVNVEETGFSEASYVLFILQDYSIFMGAAAVSPKLFQMCSSILNQLLILSAGCTCSWLPMLSLATTFAKETAKGRAEFYPTPMHPIVLLMEAEPRTSGLENYKKDVILNHLKSLRRTQLPEALVALLSHFPAWLHYIDPITLISHN